MEDEIQENLEEIYIFPIDVKFRDFGIYDVYCKIKNNEFDIPLLYNNRVTMECNILNTVQKIDNELIKIFKKGK